MDFEKVLEIIKNEMLEIKDKLSIPCKEVKTITSNSEYLFAISNSKNTFMGKRLSYLLV